MGYLQRLVGDRTRRSLDIGECNYGPIPAMNSCGGRVSNALITIVWIKMPL